MKIETYQSKAISEAYKQNNNGTKVLINNNELTIYGFLIKKPLSVKVKQRINQQEENIYQKLY